MKIQYVVALSLMTGVAIGAVAIDRLHAQAKPPGYIITEVEVIDQAKFNEFAPKASAALAKAGGRYLIRGGRTAALEGGEAPKRIVVTVFDSMEKAEAYRKSPDWMALEALRKQAAKGRAFAVEGVAQ
jgi:uncharacterized protein (DUF1330 family)